MRGKRSTELRRRGSRSGARPEDFGAEGLEAPLLKSSLHKLLLPLRLPQLTARAREDKVYERLRRR